MKYLPVWKEGKDLTEDKGTAQGIGFRHDWQMLVIESEDKIQDSRGGTWTHLQGEKSDMVRCLCYYRRLGISKVI